MIQFSRGRIQPDHSPRSFATLALVVAIALGSAGASLADSRAVLVSPGSADGIPLTPTTCPTFSWVNGSSASLDLVITSLETPGAVTLTRRVPRGATSWTPPRSDCLTEGQYVWFLRADTETSGSDRVAWVSDGLAFEVSSRPSREEFERSLRIVTQYLQATEEGAEGSISRQGVDGDSRGNARVKPRERPRNTRHPVTVPAIAGAVNLADAAISGHHSGGAGSHVGVVGSVDSPDAAGVGAENTAGGADLVLAGPVMAEVTENQWVLNNAAAQTFGFFNPSGGLSLQVQGEAVLTTSDIGVTVPGPNHDHFGELWQGSGPGMGLYVESQSPGVVGLRGDGPSKGIIGLASSTSGTTVGVEGSTLSPDQAAGVKGQAFVTGGAGEAYGVWGSTQSSGGAGGVFLNSGGGLLIAGHDAASPSPGSLKFAVDSAGNVSAASFAGDGSALTGIAGVGEPEPLSLFGTFGGNGGADRTISGTENLGHSVVSYHDLTVPAGSTLVIDKGIAFVSVSGTCNIAGTITATGKGRAGGAGGTGTNDLGKPGFHAGTNWGSGPGMVSGANRLSQPFTVAGGGGGGGGAGPWALSRGGGGGGGLALGGFGGCSPSCTTQRGGDAHADSNKRIRLFGIGSASDFFALYLHTPGGGGGGGGTGSGGGTAGAGGSGGGIVYLECGSVDFSGSIQASGDDGGDATGHAGGGGGGGGGVVLVRTLNVLANTGSIDVAGGGEGAGSGSGAGNGGFGEPGFQAVLEL